MIRYTCLLMVLLLASCSNKPTPERMSYELDSKSGRVTCSSCSVEKGKINDEMIRSEIKRMTELFNTALEKTGFSRVSGYMELRILVSANQGVQNWETNSGTEISGTSPERILGLLESAVLSESYFENTETDAEVIAGFMIDPK